MRQEQLRTRREIKHVHKGAIRLGRPIPRRFRGLGLVSHTLLAIFGGFQEAQAWSKVTRLLKLHCDHEVWAVDTLGAL